MTPTKPGIPFWKRSLTSARAAAVFGIIAVLAAADAVADMHAGLPPWNVVVDVVITTCALGAGTIYSWRSVLLRRQAQALLHRLDDARRDADRWRTEAASVLPALGAAIQRQFQRWTLTPDEQHIALMLLGGLSSKQIAELRHTTVEAVRRNTLAIYRKAGLTGRAALSAYFLQDLLFLAGHATKPREQQAPVNVVPAVKPGAHRWN